MDPSTAMAIAALMMLLNGGVLGLMHRDLPIEIRPSAVSWRISTLLFAGGCILIAVQNAYPPGFILPLANAFLFIGITGYWRAIRQFYDVPDTFLLLIPAIIGTLGIFWYSAITPHFGMRVVIASTVWVVAAFGSVWTLHARAANDASLSRRVLIGIFLLIGVFLLLRGVYFANNSSPSANLLDRSLWLNTVSPLIMAVLPVIGTTAFLLLCSDRIRRQWEHAASTDYLTGLANRRTLMQLGDRRFSQAQANRKTFAVAVIDIDHFKTVNDRFGHDTGDRALIHAAKALQRSCPPGTVLGRQGGEEFVALLDCDAVIDAMSTAERLRAALESEPMPMTQGTLPITISIGVGVATERDRNYDDTLRRADQALYAAKSGGRNRVELRAT
jgi:diguanylate cyclase (GGDEF)-like protein